MSSGFSAPCVRGSRLMRGLNQNCRCLLNLLGRMVDLFDLLRQPVVEHRKPRSVVVGASLLAVRVEGFKQHGDGFSQNHKFNHYDAASSRLAITSKGEQRHIPLGMECRASAYLPDASIMGGRANLQEASPRVDHSRLCGSDTAAQRKAQTDTAVLIEQFICTIDRALGSSPALSGQGRFEVQDFSHRSASVCFAVPSF
ncbi:MULTISPECIES: hypothetical protein [unclassified Mesorhizobium]|uniref:hypothetical protein n=2 Tax=Mesorhizobium TaxID=68287 RepID=UPI00167C12E6|nr:MULTISPECIES: hypothetical protein [unclassified Mesorhizobium]